MASVFVLLEAFNRKEAAALGFFPCATASFLWPGLRKEGNLFKLAGPGGLAFFHLTKKEVSKWPMKK